MNDEFNVMIVPILLIAAPPEPVCSVFKVLPIKSPTMVSILELAPAL